MSPKRTTARSSDYHHGDLRNALINAGRKALKDVSAQDLSLRYLARKVGVSEAAPSRHFAGIEELLAAIAATGFRELATLRSVILESDEPALSKAYRMMRVYVDFAVRQKGLFGLMIGPRIVARDAYSDLNEDAGRSFALFAKAVEAVALERKWESQHLNFITHTAWSVEHGLATLILSDRLPRPDRPIVTEELVEFALTFFMCAIETGPTKFNSIFKKMPTSPR